MPTRIPRFIGNLIGGAAIVGGSFAISLAVFNAYDRITIWNEVRRGAEVHLHFDENACATETLGTLRCGVTYIAHYEYATNTWVVTGPSSSGSGLVTEEYNNAPNRIGYISVWGLVASYDQNGTLRSGKDVVGRLEIDRWSALLHSLFGNS